MYTIYKIDNVYRKFKTLREAKNFIKNAFTNEERIKYFPNYEHIYIRKYNKMSDENYTKASYTRIMVDNEGNVRFRKTVKF